MNSTFVSIHYEAPVYLTIGSDTLSSMFGVKSQSDVTAPINFHLPYEYSERLKRAVAAFNKEMGVPYYQNTDEQELEAAE